jgi:hypothetical protein
MKRIKVRFNLSRGKNYLKWKIEYPSGEVEYHSPTDTQLIMKTCQLKNNRNIADKIFHGQHKSVCAWILCEDIEVRFDKFVAYDTMNMDQLKYNPKKLPYWVIDDKNHNHAICMDGVKFSEIGTVDFKLYVTIS